VPTNVLPAQARRGEGDVPGTTRYTCSKCRIDYHGDSGERPACPLCEAEEEMESLREQILTLAQEKGMIKDDLRRALSQLDMATSLHDSLELADWEDLAFIKSVAYRLREDPSLDVLTTSTKKDGKMRRALLVSDQDDTERHVPVSVGGVAFAETYNLLIKSMGALGAKKQFMQAVADRLA
jgi:hypothetical protein